MIIVDTNSAEDPLWGFLSEHSVSEQRPLVIERKRLDLGDVELVAYENGVATRRILVERKGWSDWSASISDGRYKEQKRRALSACDHEIPTTFMYIIENGYSPRWMDKTRGMENRALMAADLNTQLRDGLPVYHTAETEDTALVVLYLHRELTRGTLVPKRAEASMAPVAGVFKRKAACIMDGQAQYRAMLSVVHGMSEA